jgi:hypothetical protein
VLANMAAAVFGLVGVVFAAYLVAFLSLRVKRAALALGLIGAYICTGVLNSVFHIFLGLLRFAVFSGRQNEDTLDYYLLVAVASQALSGVIFLGAIFFLRRATFRRAEALAAEN